MKRFMTIAILFFAVAPAFSQKPAVVPVPVPDSIITIEPMPNAMAVKPLPEVYVGKNGKGLDIYKSLIDGMPVAKPDRTFTDRMNRLYALPSKKRSPLLLPTDSTLQH